MLASCRHMPYSFHFYTLYALSCLVRKSRIDSLSMRGREGREALRVKDQEGRRKQSQALAILAVPTEVVDRPVNELPWFIQVF